MNKQTNHIISRFRWNTSFDEKKKAAELQARLSRWSRNEMMKEISGVLDMLCPGEQVWSIELLELDLGIIDFNNLEAELTKKLCSGLDEKLLEMFQHADHNGYAGIEKQDENISRVNILSVFFLEGVLPWNYKPGYGTINNILKEALKNDRVNVIAMLHTAAKNNPEVRKRIAWQIEEPNITMIIHELEPGGSAHIVAFSNQLAGIQLKHTIVQSGGVDFKKNLWHWIFNYLFASHGTEFNRKEFLKSSIRQMADHYNLAYEKLLQSIEAAVEMVNDISLVQVDFLKTLKILTAENHAALPATNVSQPVDFNNSSPLLTAYFQDDVLPKPVAAIKEFNELVMALSHKDKPGFRKMILLLGDAESLWHQAIHHLDEYAMDAVFSARNTAVSGISMDCIHLLDTMCRVTNLNIEKKIWWQAGYNFLVLYKDAVFDTAQFFTYCLFSLERKGTILKKQMLREMLCADIPASERSITSAEIYITFKKVLVSEINQPGNAAFYNNVLKEQFDSITDVLITVPVDKFTLAYLQRSLLENIKLNPGLSYKALMQYQDKGRIELLLSYLVDNDLLNIFTGQLEKPPVVSCIEQCLIELKMQQHGKELALSIEQNLPAAMMAAILLHQKNTTSAFLESLLAKLYAAMPVSRHYQFGLFVSILLKNKKLESSGITKSFKDKIQAKYCFKAGAFISGRINELISTKQVSKAEAGKLLADFFNDTVFIQLRTARGAASEALLNYIMKGGAVLMDRTTKKYAGLLVQQVKPNVGIEISRLLKELYWKCILNYDHHQGEKEKLLQSFRAAIVLQLPVSGLLLNTNVGGKLKAKYNVDKLSSEAEILPGNGFRLIEHCFETGSFTVTQLGAKFQLDELMVAGFRSDPGKLKQTIAKIPASDKSVGIMKTVSDFSQFSHCLMNDMNDVNQQLLKKLQFLHDKSGELLPYKKNCTARNDYWKNLWQLLNTDSLTTAGLEKLLKDSVFKLQEATGMDESMILSGMKKEKTNSVLSKEEEVKEEEIIFQLSKIKKTTFENLQLYARLGWIEDLCYCIINRAPIPVWYNHESVVQSYSALLNDILSYYPVAFLRILKREMISNRQMNWLCESFNFDVLAISIGRMQINRQPLLNTLMKLYAALGKMSITGITTVQLQQLLLSKLINAWVSGNWSNVAIENILDELSWDSIVTNGVTREQFLTGIGKHASYLPASLQAALRLLNISPRKRLLRDDIDLNVQKIKQQQQKKQKLNAVAHGGIAVKNAGLVIVNSYILLLFERLGLTANNKFQDIATQLDAVHYLQYIVTGLAATDECLLPLNKVLCGLPIECPVYNGIVISEAQEQLIEELITAVIDYWPSIGRTSVDGFRGNWLVRNGVLTEQEDKWELTVERRAYDVLIGQFPFSFSIIKYPWMSKPLHVQWSY